MCVCPQKLFKKFSKDNTFKCSQHLKKAPLEYYKQRYYKFRNVFDRNDRNRNGRAHTSEWCHHQLSTISLSNTLRNLEVSKKNKPMSFYATSLFPKCFPLKLMLVSPALSCTMQYPSGRLGFALG